MAANFIHSVLVEEQDPASDAVLTHQLPVNPISGLLINIKPLNNTGTLSDYSAMSALLDALNNIVVTWRGVTLFEASGRDAYQVLRHRHHLDIIQNNQVNTNNDRRSLILPILFGKHWGDPNEGIPASRAGELELSLDVDVADTGYDDLRYGIETLELPGANFTNFTRVTTISQTFAATGFNDVVLPIGHLLRGILLFQTTGFAGATPTPGLGRLSVIRDGAQIGYTSTDVEMLRGIMAATAPGAAPRYGQHVHYSATSAADGDTNGSEQVGAIDDNYAYLDFDFARDDAYVLDTKGANRLVVRSDAEVAEAMRVLPIERVATSFLQPRT